MADFAENIILRLSRFLWGPWMIASFIGVGVFFSMRCGWLQIRGVRHWMYESVGQYLQKKRRDVSGLKSVCTLLAATVGTGNLAGVAAALIAGGPGAVFWMWIAAFLGMMTAYAENVLGVLYAGKDACGPMAYIRGLPFGGAAAAVYAVLAVCCGFCMGNLVQSNTAALAMHTAFGVPTAVTAAVLVLATGLVFAGGRKAVGRVTLILTPVMGGLFLLAAAVILWNCRARLPGTLALIVREAFRPQAAAAGTAGYGIAAAMRFGVARGVFTNEAGIGTSVFANEQNRSPKPQAQGFLAIFAVFADTIVICTLTALVLLAGGVYDMQEYARALASGTLSSLPDAASCLVRTFQMGLGPAGGGFLGILTVVFAASTLLAWSAFGAQAFTYLSGQKGERLYQVCFLLAILYGAGGAPGIIWALADIVNAGMALINLTALTVRSGEVVRLQRFAGAKKQGLEGIPREILTNREKNSTMR